MKILWVKTDFLHPTTRGGQIRSLEILRRLHRRHEIHYVAFDDPADPEGLRRSAEYASRSYPVPRRVVDHGSPRFALQLLAGVVSSLPVSVARYRSSAMRRMLAAVLDQQRFDLLVCDFLFPAPNLPDPKPWVLFQHNVETVLWQRRAARPAGLAQSSYLQLQARRMFRYEASVCRAVRKVLAVSEADAAAMRRMYGIADVPAVPTGVDLEYFAPPAAAPAPFADLCFLGSMDWMPNVDGAIWFVRQVLPLIHRRRPQTVAALVGRKPDPRLQELAGPGVRITGTVPDVRPYLFGSLVSIVPLHVGGGTRLKIYESMAARVPVVSTALGAEGLDVAPGKEILLAGEPDDFAEACLRFLECPAERERLAAAAWDRVSSRHSWEAAAAVFERLA